MITKEACLALAAAQHDELHAIGQEPDFYTLEEELDQFWTALGHLVLEQTLGPVPANQQKNSVQTRFGRVAIAKTNPFSAPVLSSRTARTCRLNGCCWPLSTSMRTCRCWSNRCSASA